MFYFIAHYFTSNFPILNVLKYITFRSICAMLFAFLLTMIICPRFINYLKFGGRTQPIREDGPETHLKKSGTPTMGGVVIVLVSLLSTLFWSNFLNIYVILLWIIAISYAILGFIDDYLKISKKNSRGVSYKTKLVWQLGIAAAVALIAVMVDSSKIATSITVPFFKDYFINLSWFYLVFAAIVIVGSSNAVNLTDGLDGLATGPLIIILGYFALIAYIVGNTNFANYLQITHIPGTGEMVIVCAAMIGASLGFLWYNAPPAKIFMGDVGSLSLGGAVGAMSVFTKHEFALFFAGGLFVIEALSVILQVASFKIYKKRIFKMAPIHHHFEKMGWSESTVVIRFWIIALMFGLLGLAMLKLR